VSVEFIEFVEFINLVLIVEIVGIVLFAVVIELNRLIGLIELTGLMAALGRQHEMIGSTPTEFIAVTNRSHTPPSRLCIFLSLLSKPIGSVYNL
jgi:hypothetical protein